MWNHRRPLAPALFCAVPLLASLVGAAPQRVAAQRPALDGGGSLAMVLLPVEPELAVRIKGQTADLQWRLKDTSPEAASPNAPSASVSHVALARDIAAHHGARVVLWIEDQPDQLVLRLLDAQARRLLTRRFSQSRSTRSAALEALALAIRASLQAIAEGDALGEPVTAVPAARERPSQAIPSSAESAASTAPVNGEHGVDGTAQSADAAEAPNDSPNDAATDVARTGPEPEPAAPNDANREAGIGFGIAAGGSQLVDGVSRGGLWGAWLAPRLAVAGIGLALRVEHTVESPVRDRQGDLTLARRGMWLLADLPFATSTRSSLRPGLGVGVVEHLRHTRRVAADLAPTEDNGKVSGALELAVAFDLVAADLDGTAIGFSARAGCQLLLAAPILRYMSAEGPTDRSLWTLAPTLSVGVFLR